jgi:hypothetical protein
LGGEERRGVERVGGEERRGVERGRIVLFTEELAHGYIYQ